MKHIEEERAKKSRGSTLRDVTLQMQLFKAILITTAVMFIVLIMALLFSGVIRQLDDNAFSAVMNMNRAKAEMVSYNLAMISRSLSDAGVEIQHKLNGLASGGGTELNSFFNSAYTSLERFMLANSVTGVYLVLKRKDETELPALYLHTALFPAQNETALQWGDTGLENIRQLPPEDNWSRTFTLSGDAERDAFYLKPLEAYELSPGADMGSLGYWCVRDAFGADASPVLSYSAPLADNDGEPAGILGFEISYNMLNRLLPFNDMPFNGSFYAMGLINGGSIERDTLVSADAPAAAYFQKLPDKAAFEPVTHSRGLMSAATDAGEMYFSAVPLNLYGRDSVFADPGFTLFAFSPKSELTASSAAIMTALGVTVGSAVILMLIGSYYVSRYITGKVTAAAAKVKQMIGHSEIHSLPKTNIREIDGMLVTIEAMSSSIAANAAKMSSIVDLMGYPIGVFETASETGMVFVTRSVYRVLGIEGKEDGLIPLERLYEILPVYKKAEEEGEEEVIFKQGGRWLSLRLSRHTEAGNKRVDGAISDVTERMLEKERLVYENTYDGLTRLLNRNAYMDKIKEIIASAPDKRGVLAYIDLDKLKTINDTYGHNNGDKYLQMAGNAFSLIERMGGLAARVGGDEFVLYLHGMGSREELRAYIDKLLTEGAEKELEFFDGSAMNLHFSTGLAFYPDDSTELGQLLAFADFAMYEAKHNAKGTVFEFNRARYDNSGYAAEHATLVETILREASVRYAFQPVADLRTGEIIAHEAIMRPRQSIGDHSPLEILTMARVEDKLYDLERLLFMSFCQFAHDNMDQLTGKTLAFNTIRGQYLSEHDFDEAYALIGDAIRRGDLRLVMEIPTIGPENLGTLEKKIHRAKERSLRISFNKYTGELVGGRLNVFKPDYMRITMDIVHGIHVNDANQRVIRSVIAAAEKCGAITIAEGIETYRELKAVSDLGVRYGQGFFLNPPEYRLQKELPGQVVEAIRGTNYRDR